MSIFRGNTGFSVYGKNAGSFALTLWLAAVLTVFSSLVPGLVSAGMQDWRSADIDGIRLISQKTDGPLAAVCVFVGIGSAQESPGNNGITSLLNNLILSSNPVSESPAVLEIERLGGTVEVETGLEYSCFKLAVPVKNLAAAMGLLGRAIAGPPLNEQSLRAIKRRMAGRAGKRRDMPVEMGYRLCLQKTYAGSAYGLQPEGEPESLRGLNLADVSGWHSGNFVRSNVLVSVCANLDADGAEKMIRSALGTLPEKELPSAGIQYLVTPGESGTHILDGGTSSEESVALVGYAAPAVGSPDYPAAVLVEAVLADGMGSRLFRSLRVDGKLAYSFGSRLPVMSSGGMLAFYVRTDAGMIDDAARSISDAVESLKKGELGEDELARAKGRAIGEMALQADGLVDRARRSGLAEFMGVGRGYWEELSMKIAKADAKDVVKAARKYMDSRTLVLLKPAEKGR